MTVKVSYLTKPSAFANNAALNKKIKGPKRTSQAKNSQSIYVRLQGVNHKYLTCVSIAVV